MTATGLDLSVFLLDDEVTGWLRPILERLVGDVDDVPLFGSAEWRSASDERRLASALRAAEAWRREGLTLAQSVRADLEASDYQAQLDDTAEWSRLGAWVRKMAATPTHEELTRRRAEVVRPITSSIGIAA